MTTDRIEQAAPDVREVLFKAAMQLGQYWPSEKRMIFRRFLDAEAYTDAALMLIPEGWGFTVATYWCDDGEDRPPYFADCVDITRVKQGDYDAPVYQAWASHPALAIAAASLRAKGPGHAQ